MTEKLVFADVDLPFHVWVKEGTRWVLRDAAAQLRDPSIAARLDAGAVPPPSNHRSIRA